MKNFILLLALVLSMSPVLAQEKAPTYEKKGDVIEATFYHDNGLVKQHGFYTLDGKLQGVWTTFNIEGKKTAVGNYEKGNKVGKWFFWNDKVLNEVDYENNRVANVVKWTDKTKVAVRD